MKKRSIALVAHAIHFRGGQERNFAELATRLTQEYEVHLIVSEIEDIPTADMTVHCIPIPRRPMACRFPIFYGRASRFLKRHSFDIVHAIGGIVRRQDIVTAQFCHAAWIAHVQASPPMPGFTPYHLWMSRMARCAEQRAMTDGSTRAILANSAKTRADLIRHYQAPPEKIHVIYNGVDTARFAPAAAAVRRSLRAALGYGESDFLVLFVGEFLRKNLTAVVRALPLLPGGVKLLAVGRGDKSYYRALAAKLGVADRLTLRDPIRQVETVFQAADAFAFPTLYEPFGMVITEALACGLPVITTGGAGAAELIRPGVNGFLVTDPHDVPALACRLRRLADDPPQRQALGQAARASVCEVTWDEIAQQTMAVYRETGG